MSNDDLEHRIRDWQANLTVISRNLMDLAELELTKRVRARLKDPTHGYQGVTAERALRAFNALDGLWQDYLLLARVVEDAAELARKNGIFRNTEDEVIALLEGASVKLPSIHVPLPTRDLLAKADRSDSARPDEVLNAMRGTFAMARDALLSIGEAETRVAPRIAAVARETETLERWAVTLGIASLEVEPVDQMEVVEADPLGAAINLDRVEARLAVARTQLEGLERERDAVSVALERGRARLCELKDLSQRTHAAIEETRLRIANPGRMVEPIADEIIASLAAWLATLEKTLAAGRWQAAAVGLQRWEANCATRLEAERSAYKHNCAELDERTELRGRFRALCAKAQSYEQRGVALGETLARMAEETDEALSARPFNLESGRRLVAMYEAALAAKTNRRRNT